MKSDSGGTHDERLEEVEDNELRVRAREVDGEERDERGGVDRGGLHECLDDVPLRGRGRRGAHAVAAHAPRGEPDPERNEDCRRGEELLFSAHSDRGSAGSAEDG